MAIKKTTKYLGRNLNDTQEGEATGLLEVCVANTSLAGPREGRRGEHSTSPRAIPWENSGWLVYSVGGTASSSAFPQV